MPSPSLLRSIPPSALITGRPGPAAPSLTFRSVLIGGTGKNSTAMYYNHVYDPKDTPVPLPRKSSTWSHFTSAPEPYSLSRCLSFPLSLIGGGSSMKPGPPIGRRNNLVSYPATFDRPTANPTASPTSSSQYPSSCAPTGSASVSTIRSPRQAPPRYIKGAGLPSRDTLEKPPGYTSFSSLGTCYQPPHSGSSTRASTVIHTATGSEKASAVKTPESRRRRPRQSLQRRSCGSTSTIR